jgi:release factor glutamine methyltransferase
MQTLLSSLTRTLGRSSAQRELRWMREALVAPRPSTPMPTLEQMVERRIAGEPLQYILGTQPFGPLNLRVRPPTLIPRSETEEWTLRVAELLRPTRPKKTRILDLCTGTGCIPLLLCASWAPQPITALGVDISDDALALARENAEDCRVDLAGGLKDSTIDFLQANVLSESFAETLRTHRACGPAGFDLITSNPPYIPLGEWRDLDTSVKEWEDPRALIGDPEDWPVHLQPEQAAEGQQQADRRGLAFYRALARLAAQPGILASGCPLVMEVGHDQAGEVDEILQGTGAQNRAFTRIERWKDAWDVERVVIGWKR